MEQENEVVEEATKDQTVETVDESKFDSAGDDSVMKVDLSKPPTPVENEVEESDADDSGVVASVEDAEPTQEQEEVQPEAQTQEDSALEEITGEEITGTEEEIEEAISMAEETGDALPENLQKLVDFMKETGGDLNDYVKLNQDYSELDDQNLLREFYTQTKPHLNSEEINFLMEDTFSYDEEEDDDRDIRRKKLALKEQVADAKSHLDGQKSKYYEEIKMGSKLPEEAQKAMNFFNRYNKESKESDKHAELQAKTFSKKTNEVFNDKFKGFEYNVGEKKFRFNVNNVDSVKVDQSSINNFVGKFLDKNNLITDAKSYHKSLFTANNADAVAAHFYEQGKSDALKESIANSKNIDMSPRQANKPVDTGGMKFKVLGDDSSSFKFKIKNNK
tara:strand:- start:1053 stop:2222 length:1170 start_codon:yes stop_codon:yes gene_type:complete